MLSNNPLINEIADTELILSRGDLRLKVSPYGASLRGLWREQAEGQQREEIITGYTGAQGKMGGQGDVLIPFPGRVRDGRYSFGGENYQMPINDRDGPNAIHGFVRLAPWEVREQTQSSATFRVNLEPEEYEGYPFRLQTTVTYSLSEDDSDTTGAGMTCRFTIENTGERPAPVAAGFHPYFTVGSDLIDGDLLHLPLRSILKFDEGLLPTGQVLPVEGTPYDFREPRTIGATRFNTCYLDPVRDPDGLLRIRLTAPDARRAVTVWMDAAFPYVVVYSGDPMPPSHRRRALAIEPMTCGSDAFNHTEWGLAALAPGETLEGAWGVTLS